MILGSNAPAWDEPGRGHSGQLTRPRRRATAQGRGLTGKRSSVLPRRYLLRRAT